MMRSGNYALPVLWSRLRRLWADDSGVVMLETVLVFPTQLLIMMVIIQFAHMYAAANVVQYAAFQGARTAAVNFRGGNTSEAYERGCQAAWGLVSTINNTGGGSRNLRVPCNNYSYYSDTEGRLQVWMSALDGSGSSTAAKVRSADTLIYAKLAYKMDLTVPIGGPFIYRCLKAMGNDTSVSPTTDVGQVTITESGFVPKPWPH